MCSKKYNQRKGSPSQLKVRVKEVKSKPKFKARGTMHCLKTTGDIRRMHSQRRCFFPVIVLSSIRT